MNLKWTYEKINDYIKENAEGYVLNKIERLEKSKIRIYVKCDKGHLYDINFDGFQKGARCSICSHKKLTYEMIKKCINGQESNDCELITTEKEFEEEKLKQNKTNNTVKLLIKCKCGNKFKTDYSTFTSKNKKQCDKCGKIEPPNKFKYDFVKKFIEKYNCKLLTKEKDYINANKNIEIQCHCGNKFNTTFMIFKNKEKKQCTKCNKKIVAKLFSFTYEEVKKYIEKDSNSGCKLLSTEYINNQIPLDIQCKCGKIFHPNYNSFKGGQIECPKCSKEKIAQKYLKTNEQFLKEVEEQVGNEYTFLEEYKGNKTKIKVRHNCEECNNYEWKMKPSNFLMGKRCPKCAGNLPYSDEEFKEKIYSLVKDEYTILGKYINAKTKIKIRHNICGNKYKTTSNNFLNGNRCPICVESKGEQFIRHYCEKNSILFDPQYIFNDLIGIGGGLLKFDFSIYKNEEKSLIKYLIEYDGKQHYEWIEGLMTYEKFHVLQMHDKLKNQYCINHNVKLIRIPYWEFDNIEKILNDVLINNNINNKFFINGFKEAI